MGTNIPLLFSLSDGSKISYEELRAHVKVLEPGILLMKELEKPTCETLQILHQLLVQEGQAFERVVYVVDISEAEALPTAEYRKSIIDWMKNAPYDHMCMVQSGFGVIRVAMRFVVARANSSITVHKDMDEALRKARSVL